MVPKDLAHDHVHWTTSGDKGTLPCNNDTQEYIMPQNQNPSDKILISIPKIIYVLNCSALPTFFPSKILALTH